MADNEFDLGEAYSSYEQARADRNFYLSMVQGGTQMASPIAAYLAGVAGVKMAGERAKVQNIEDNIQAQKDATAATERLQKRQDNLRTQLISIVKGVQDGTIPASVGATMVGHVGKELGLRVKQYMPKEGKLVYNEGSDPTDYEWDWKESPSVKERGLTERAEKRMEWEAEKQKRGIEGQISVAEKKAAIKKASGETTEKPLTVSDFNRLNPKIDSFMKADLPFEDQYPTKEEIISYIKMLPRLQSYAQDPAYENILNVMNRLGYSAEEQKALIQKASYSPDTKGNATTGAQDFSGISDNDFLKMMPTK